MVLRKRLQWEADLWNSLSAGNLFPITAAAFQRLVLMRTLGECERFFVLSFHRLPHEFWTVVNVWLSINIILNYYYNYNTTKLNYYAPFKQQHQVDVGVYIGAITSTSDRTAVIEIGWRNFWRSIWKNILLWPND